MCWNPEISSGWRGVLGGRGLLPPGELQEGGRWAGAGGFRFDWGDWAEWSVGTLPFGSQQFVGGELGVLGDWGERGWFEALMFGVEGGLSFPYFLEFGQGVNCFLLNVHGVLVL